jgi:hypothetical protein
MQSLIMGVNLSGRSSCIGYCVRWPQVIAPSVGITESRTRAKSTTMIENPLPPNSPNDSSEFLE